MALGRQFPLIDRLLDGGLEPRLRELREQDGKSLFDITLILRDEGFAVSPETVRQWCKELRIQKRDDGEAA